MEIDKVLDLSKGLQEKYGPLRGWQFGLRYQEKDGVLDYNDPISYTNGCGSPLGSVIKDNRAASVELIRVS